MSHILKKTKKQQQQPCVSFIFFNLTLTVSSGFSERETIYMSTRYPWLEALPLVKLTITMLAVTPVTKSIISTHLLLRILMILE